MFSLHTLVYFSISALSGLLCGLLGAGVELLLIPLVYWILKSKGIPKHLLFNLSVGTSLASLSVISFFSGIFYWKRKLVNKQLLKKLLIGVKPGIIGGGIAAKYIPSLILIIGFGVLSITLSLLSYFSKTFHQKEKSDFNLSTKVTALIGVFIGAIAGMIGINAFTIYVFRKIGLDLKTSIGTSLVLSTILAIGISIIYIIMGWNSQSLPKYSTGFISWRLAIPMAIAGSIFTPLGAYLSKKISSKLLKLFYCLLLAVIGIRMLLFISDY